MSEEYKDLKDVISFEGFRFSYYYEDEKTVLKPRLEALGYSQVSFFMGERDSFGPLSRVVYATKDGVRERFVYG